MDTLYNSKIFKVCQIELLDREEMQTNQIQQRTITAQKLNNFEVPVGNV